MTIAKETLFRWGRPLGPLYEGLMKLRAAAYRAGWLASVQLPVPVVSVGNLTMGGTGKTPLVIALARLLLAAGRRPAVVSRGYGGQATGSVNLVSDGANLLLDAGAAGDEPRLLAESLPGVVVATGRERRRVARFVIEKLAVDVVILDDGFQHLGVRRDLDLVLFKGPDFLGNGLVFPGGDLREPLTALVRAQAFVLTGIAPEGDGGESVFRRWLTTEFPGRPVFTIPYRGGALQPGNDRALEAHGAGAKLLAFCGLARPETFRRMLLDRGYDLTGFHPFPDHHSYTRADLEMLGRQAEKTAATALVTTAKDLVKLRHLECPWPLYVLPAELELPGAFAELVLASL